MPLATSRAATIVALIALLATAAASASGGSPERAGNERPNVIVVLTDDQSVAELSRESMPHTVAELAEHGTSFSESVVSSPLCCPSRAGFLTGQYPHNNGVYDNEPGFAALLDKNSIIYSWLQAAGYRTGHVGRYLLNYDRPPPPNADYDTAGGLAAPPGLDYWYGFVGSQALYWNATFSDNGTPVTAGSGPRGYTTRIINRAALDFVRGSASDPRPFFLMVAHVAPHSSNVATSGACAGGMPKPEDGKLGPFKNDPLPKSPSFDEQRIGDKPAWVRARPPLGHTRRANLKLGWRCANATLETVDRGVKQLVDQLAREGELDDTAIFFTSDNGYLFGEHRIFLQKVYPYEESLRVPLLARVPADLLGRRVQRQGRPKTIATPVDNLDLTATILDLADAAPCTAGGDCRVLDGRSLRPLLRGRRPDWTRGRTLLFQIGTNRTCGVPPSAGLRNFYDGIRTPRYVYVELDRVNRETAQCDRPEYELYDLKKDPYQLRNRAANPARGETPSPLQDELARRLAILRACSGVAGRDAPTGRPFCD
jgi:N-acetylglucosamine-6-sulfatase